MSLSIRELNDLRRAENCCPLSRDPDVDELFFCSLGTLWCTEAHGDYEIPTVEGAHAGTARRYGGVVECAPLLCRCASPYCRWRRFRSRVTSGLRRRLGVPFRAMIAVLIAILLAALVYWICLALGLPVIVGVIAAILVLIGGIGTGGGVWGRRL